MAKGSMESTPESSDTRDQRVALIGPSGSHAADFGHYHESDLETRIDESEIIALLQNGAPNVFRSNMNPPEDLWDLSDWHYLDKVKCKMEIEMRCIDPRNGAFTGRIIAHWFLRTLNINDRTEPRVRVPGLRTQRLVANVEESRIWREIAKDTEGTIFWQGTSVITFSGFEIFEVHDFPYDRQVINLDLFEFVWRSDKDSADYDQSMQVVDLDVTTSSMLPEWGTFKALVYPRWENSRNNGPSFCSNFVIQVRVQRKERYYITQIFLVTYLLLAASLLPLGLAPGDTHIGDRLAVHAAGLLTLVAFKYGVQHDMPTVPYSTFTSTFLTYQIVTLVMVSVESLISYKMVQRGGHHANQLDDYEDGLLVLLIIGWGMWLIYCAFFKTRESWESVLINQMAGGELLDDDHEWDAACGESTVYTGMSPSHGMFGNSCVRSHTRIHL